MVSAEQRLVDMAANAAGQRISGRGCHCSPRERRDGLAVEEQRCVEATRRENTVYRIYRVAEQSS